MKLSPLTIIIIGLMFFFPMLSLGYFMYWVPNNTEADMYAKNLEDLNTEAGKLPQAKKRRDEAIAKVKAAANEWQSYVVDRTPPKGLPEGIDLSVNAYQLTVDVQTFRNSIQKAINAQMRTGGVKVLNGPAIPEIDPNQPANSTLASFFNYPAIAFPVVIFDLGTVTVQGTMKQIFDNMRGWSRMPHYLAVADGLRLDGTSPVLTGTYNLSVVGYIRGHEIAPSVAEASGGGSGGAMGAMAAGMPPGMPPGMMGGPRGAAGGPPAGAGARGKADD